MESLFIINFQMKYTFRKIDTYDKFCAPGSHGIFVFFYIFKVQKLRGV